MICCKNSALWPWVAVAFVFVHCDSPFDASTSLGEQVINNHDPSITDFNSTVAIDSIPLPVDSCYSLEVKPAAGTSDTASDIGLSADAALMAVGRFGRQSSVGYVEFSDTSVLDTSYRAVEAFLVFTPEGGSYAQDFSERLRVYATDTLPSHQMRVKESDTSGSSLGYVNISSLITQTLVSISYDTIPTDQGDSLYIKADTQIVYVYGADRNSVAASVDDSLLGVNLSRDSMKIHRGFFILPSPEARNVIRFAPPTLLLQFKKTVSAGGETDTVIDTVSLHPTFSSTSVWEQDSGRSSDTISVIPVQRQTIVKLDLRPVWDTLAVNAAGDTLRSVLDAGLRLTLSDLATAEDDNVSLRFALLGQAPEPGAIVDTSSATFFTKSIVSPGVIVLDFNGALEKFERDAGGRPDFGYLCLTLSTAAGSWAEARWNIAEGVWFNAVFSNPR